MGLLLYFTFLKEFILHGEDLKDTYMRMIAQLFDIEFIDENRKNFKKLYKTGKNVS
jgi:hypothetical protein